MMNRFFTLLLAASCLTAVGQSSYDSSADSNGDGCVQLDDLLNILGSYGSCVDLNFDCTLASQLFKLPVAIRDSLVIYFVPGEFTWFEGEAIAQCLSSSGHLATIASSEQAIDYWHLNKNWHLIGCSNAVIYKSTWVYDSLIAYAVVVVEVLDGHRHLGDIT